MIIIAGGLAYVFWQAALGKEWALLSIMAGATVLLSIEFRSRYPGNPGLDWQTSAKVLTWGGMLAICLINAASLARFLEDRVITAFGCYCLIALLSAVYSPVPLMTAVSAIGIIAYLSFACLLVSRIPPRTLIVVLLWGFSFVSLLNVLSAFVLPDVAYMQDDPDDILHTHQPDMRLQGLFGQPNNLGRFSSIFAILVFLAANRGYVRPRFWIPNAVLAVGVTVASFSRAAVAALGIGLLLQVPRRYLVIMVSSVALCGTIILSAGQGDAVLGLIGRNGSADEAVSMAGRTDLWEFVWNLIINRPLIGYGFNSFELYASTFWTGQSGAGVAAHNNYLEVLYSTGIVGAIAFLYGLLVLLYRWLVHPDPPRDFLIINVIVCGLSELDVPSISVVPSMIFFIVLALDAKRRQNAAEV
jgi:O-antigen ligase